MLAQWQWHLTRETYWYSASGTLHKKNHGAVTVRLYWKKILAQWQWHYSRKISEQWQWRYCYKILVKWVTLTREYIGTATVTLNTIKILAQWHFTRDKYCNSESHFIQGRQLISARTFQVCWSILKIFVTQALHASPFMNCALYGSRRHGRDTWLEGANKILPRFLHFLSDSYKIRCTRFARKFVK
jgi:hypothetical protein